MDAYFFAEDDMTPVLQWGERLQNLMTRFNGFPSTEIEGKVLGSLQGLMYAAPHHPLIRALETSVETFLHSFNDLPRTYCHCLHVHVSGALARVMFTERSVSSERSMLS